MEIAASFTNLSNVLPSLPGGSVELYLGLSISKCSNFGFQHSNQDCREEVWVNRSTQDRHPVDESTPLSLHMYCMGAQEESATGCNCPAVPEDLHAR